MTNRRIFRDRKGRFARFHRGRFLRAEFRDVRGRFLASTGVQKFKRPPRYRPPAPAPLAPKKRRMVDVSDRVMEIVRRTGAKQALIDVPGRPVKLEKKTGWMKTAKRPTIPKRVKVVRIVVAVRSGDTVLYRQIKHTFRKAKTPEQIGEHAGKIGAQLFKRLAQSPDQFPQGMEYAGLVGWMEYVRPQRRVRSRRRRGYGRHRE